MVLFVGRFTAVKRAALLVRAHAIARGRLPAPLPLVLWGGFPGEWEGEHPADAAARSPWGHEVFLAGWRDHAELPAALAASDVMAVPSIQERFGLAYIEAMAMGVPPIACAAGAPPHLHRRRPRLAVAVRLARAPRRRAVAGRRPRRGGGRSRRARPARRGGRAST